MTTSTGRMLAAFLLGLLPETTQFDGQIAAIEAEARADLLDRLAAGVRPLHRGDFPPDFPDASRGYARGWDDAIAAVLALIEEAR